MKNTKVSVLNSILAGILICGMLASCGEAEKKFAAPLEPAVSTSSNVPTHTYQSRETASESETPVKAQETFESETAKSPEHVSELSEDLYTDKVTKVIDTAKSLLGVKYASGKCSPEDGFDSSGFAYYCLKEAGIEFPRRIKDQIEAGEKVGYSDLKPGDIAFFSVEEGGGAAFCGIYVGGGLIIYSPAPGGAVKTSNITTGYWTARFVQGVRP